MAVQISALRPLRDGIWTSEGLGCIDCNDSGPAVRDRWKSRAGQTCPLPLSCRSLHHHPGAQGCCLRPSSPLDAPTSRQHGHPQRLSGIYTPNLVPLDDRGEINEPVLRQYIDWLIAKGSTGSTRTARLASSRAFTTPKYAAGFWRLLPTRQPGACRFLPGRRKPHTRDDQGLRVCPLARAAGGRDRGPFYYKLSAGAVYAYFKEIARNTPIDVTLYNIPLFASPIDVPTVQRLSE